MSNKHFSDIFRQIILIFLIIVTTILALLFWEGHQGFSMSDEGFLWYGAQRVLQGEVPCRDFNSYDIGRYYWSAAFMKFVGDNGVVTLRMAAMLFQTMALFIGFLAFVRYSKKQSSFFWVLVLISLMVWMVHPHKLFDVSLPIIMIGSFSYLVDKPSYSRYLLTGLIVGLVAVFGRNHGFYGVIGGISILLYLMIKREHGPKLMKAFPCWSFGVVLGYLPILIFLVFVPGFAPAFWEMIRPVVGEATQPSLPMPWPWLLPFEKLSIIETLRGMIVGMIFIVNVTFGVLGIAWVIRQRVQKRPVSPVFVASVFLALPYAHYAFFRPDFFHLSRSTLPFLIGIFALLADQPKKIKWFFATLLFCISLFIMLPTHPGWYCFSKNQCVNIKVADDNLKVPFKTAIILKDLNNLVQKYAPRGQNFICAPFCPAAYAVFGRKSPMWDIYALSARSEAFQQVEIERIKVANPSLVIIDNSPLDGRDESRFRNTRPIIHQYILDNFQRLNDFTQNPAIYRSKQIHNEKM